MRSGHPFWFLFATAEYADNTGARLKRWHIDKDLRLDDYMQKIFDTVGPVDKWNGASMHIECYSQGPLQDMPWFSGERHVVSDRLKTCLEREASAQIQFLPLGRFVCRRKTIKTPPYWVANWLIEVDCADREKSFYTTRHGDECLGIPHIVPSRVPRDVMVFLIKDCGSWTVVRADLMMSLQREGFTGCSFGSVELAEYR